MAKTTKRSRSEAASKAVRTRNARNTFFDMHPTAYRVALLTAQGHETEWVADELGLSDASVRAYKANLSRNTYSPWLEMCNF